MLAGVIYGSIFYKKPITLARWLAAHFIVSLVCNVILNTWCLSILYGKGFLILLPPRIMKNLIMWPIDSLIFFNHCKASGDSGGIPYPGKGKDCGFIKGISNIGGWQYETEHRYEVSRFVS